MESGNANGVKPVYSETEIKVFRGLARIWPCLLTCKTALCSFFCSLAFSIVLLAVVSVVVLGVYFGIGAAIYGLSKAFHLIIG